MSGGERPVVWITRPQPGADRTAVHLEAAGFSPLVLPLTEILPCDPDIDPDDAARADCVAVTSANAIRLAPKALREALADKPVYAVGDATKAVAAAHGFASVTSAKGAVDDLAALITATEKPSASVLYLCGRTRAGDLEGKLAAKGFSCRAAEIYEAKIVSQVTHEMRTALKRRNPGAVLLHSALSAQALAGLETDIPRQLIDNAMFFAISPRVAQALPASLQARSAVATAPDEESLVAILRARFAP